MSKARNTGNLNNAIKISDTGAITFVSGSTTLMAVSPSGQLSGSAPVMSASFAQTAVTSSYATNFTVTGNLTAQTLVVQTITSSVDFVTGSTRFGSIGSNTHVFTGSMSVSGSGTFGALSGTSATFSGSVTAGGYFYANSTSPNSSGFIPQLGGTGKGWFAAAGTTGDLLNEAATGDLIIRSQLGRILLGTYQSGGSDAYAALTIANNRNVGIGTSSPSDFGGGGLTMGSTSSGKNIILYSSSNGNNGLIQFIDVNGNNSLQIAGTSVNQSFYGYGDRYMNFSTNGTERMRITSGGNVLIGTTSAIGFAFEVNGSIWGQKFRLNDTAGGYVTWEMVDDSRWTINYLGRFSGYGAGTLTTDSSGNITASSDRKLKNVIKPVENVLDKVMEFEPVYFKWNEKTDLDKENVYISTIAQSIEKNFPEAVGKMADGTLTVQDRAVLAIAIAAIQEQQAQIEAQAAQIQELKELIAAN